MATRFAIGSGIWSSGGTWDNGVGPVAGDDIYANGYTVTINQNINFATLSNSTTPVYLPDKSTPKMITNSSPSGRAIASIDTNNAYKAFDETSGTIWSTTSNPNWLGYVFPTPKTIKRYYLNFGGRPSTSWTFDGSNDGTIWSTIHSVTGNSSGTYLSSGLTNTTGFTYYRINSLVSQTPGINYIDTFEMTENTTGTTYGVTGGGSYIVPATLSGTTTINSSGAGLICNASINVITINATSGNTVNFTKDVGNGIYIIGPAMVGGNTTASGIRVAGTATVNYIGDLYGDDTGTWYSNAGDINIAAAATFNLYGNIFTPRGNPSTAHYVLNSSVNGATINIVGSVYGTSTNPTLCQGVYNSTNSTVNIIGNVVGNLGYAVNNVGTGALNVQGVVQSTSLSTLAAIISTSTGLVTLSGPVINTNNTMAVYASRLRFYSGTTQQWRFQDTANATRVLYQSGYTGTTIGLPVSTDVRNNTVYGQYNELRGTLIVPSPSDVRINVLTDNTVGTGQLTAEDFLNAITASTNSIAVRLKNISTTQTMGDQLAALSGRT